MTFSAGGLELMRINKAAARGHSLRWGCCGAILEMGGRYGTHKSEEEPVPGIEIV